MGARTDQVATGMALVSAVVTNVSGAPCSLSGAGLETAAAQLLDLPASEATGAPVPSTGPGPAAVVPAGGTVPLTATVPALGAGGGTCPLSLDAGPGGPVSLDLPVPCTPAPLPGGPVQVPALPGVPVVPAPPLAPLPDPAPAAPTVSIPGIPAPPGLPSAGAGTISGLSPPTNLPALPLPALPLPALPLPALPLPPLPSLGNPPPSASQASGPTARYGSGATGYDISWPQCGGSYPPSSQVAVVGANDGRALTDNPCLSSEAAWAGSGLDLYMNLNSPVSDDSTDRSGPAGTCNGNANCLAYNYGYNAAKATLALVGQDGLTPRMWWLDIETVGGCSRSFPTAGNGYWSCNQSLNSLTIQGALDAIRATGETVGIYCTNYQWGIITGGYSPTGGAPPNWLAGDNASPPSSWCDGSHDFAGGAPWLLQLWPSQNYDKDEAC